MNQVAIIPARMASTRMPDKPMADIHGMPMIGHLYHRCRLSSAFAGVYVATCDQVVFDYITSIGGQAIMTADTHERASDRAAEAMIKVEQMTGKRIDVVAMVQGDEPMLTRTMLQALMHPFSADPSIEIVNLMASLKSREEQEDINEVKVVVDMKENALYFSREPIPSWRKGGTPQRLLKQLGIIAFRRDFLEKFNSLPQTPLEIVESVDMLRVLEHGYPLKMVHVTDDTYSVDTIADLENVRRRMENDPFMKEYVK